LSILFNFLGFPEFALYDFSLVNITA